MRNIGEIFVADLKNATKSAVGVVVLVGLVVVPAMYAWFNILGGWDPYENTDGLKIAVANADEGYSSDLVPVDLNIGDSVVAALRANDQFAWEFVSEDEAVESVRSGSCYAAIVIPESFSADMMTLFSTDIKHSDIVYYSNQKENAIAPRVTDKGASAVQASIDETFASTVDEVGLKAISQLITFMDGDAMSSYAATLSRNLEYLEADLDNAADQATAFSALLVSTSSLVQTTSGIMGDSGPRRRLRGARSTRRAQGLRTWAMRFRRRRRLRTGRLLKAARASTSSPAASTRGSRLPRSRRARLRAT